MGKAETLGDLLVAVATGDQSAFQRLYAATSAKLFGVIGPHRLSAVRACC